MKIQTRYFGEVEIGDEKIVHFDKGLFGFEEYKDYTILYDIDGGGTAVFLMVAVNNGAGTGISDRKSTAGR